MAHLVELLFPLKKFAEVMIIEINNLFNQMLDGFNIDKTFRCISGVYY